MIPFKVAGNDVRTPSQAEDAGTAKDTGRRHAGMHKDNQGRLGENQMTRFAHEFRGQLP